MMVFGRPAKGCLALALLALSARAALAGAKSADGSFCLSGVPCGSGCTMGAGRCINGRCFDPSGTVEFACMAPFWQPDAAPPHFFAPFAWWPPLFKPMPFPDMGPLMQPFRDACGNACEPGQFCDAAGTCRPDDCASRHAYGCPGDKGDLRRVACSRASGFRECFESSSGGFTCHRGPLGVSIACAARDGTGGSVSSSSSGMDAGSGGFVASSVVASSRMVPPPAQQPAAATSTAATASTAAATRVQPAAAVQSATAAADAAAPAAGHAGEAAPPETLIQAQAAPRAQAAFIQGGAAPAMNPDGSWSLSGQPGGGPISITQVAPDGSAAASRSASGDWRTVRTQLLPGGGSAVTSSSMSGSGGPAVASASAGGPMPPMPAMPAMEPLPGMPPMPGFGGALPSQQQAGEPGSSAFMAGQQRPAGEPGGAAARSSAGGSAAAAGRTLALAGAAAGLLALL